MADTSKQAATKQLRELLEKVFVAATGGRAMTPEMKTIVADECYDIVTAVIDAVTEEQARAW